MKEWDGLFGSQRQGCDCIVSSAGIVAREISPEAVQILDRKRLGLLAFCGQAGRVPEQHRSVETRRGERPAIGREGESPNERRVSFEAAANLGSCHLPETNRPIGRTPGQHPVVRRKSDREHTIFLSHAERLCLAGRDIP